MFRRAFGENLGLTHSPRDIRAEAYIEECMHEYVLPFNTATLPVDMA